MRFLFYVVLGMIVFWLWVFFGSQFHCPRCGKSLRYGPPFLGGKYRSCECGWRDGS